MKTMTWEQFRDEGYLRELNRRFLHPLGLALGVMADEQGSIVDTFIWDERQDPEGILFEDELLDCPKARLQAARIDAEALARLENRHDLFGALVQPIPGSNREWGT